MKSYREEIEPIRAVRPVSRTLLFLIVLLQLLSVSGVGYLVLAQKNEIAPSLVTSHQPEEKRSPASSIPAPKAEEPPTIPQNKITEEEAASMLATVRRVNEAMKKDRPDNNLYGLAAATTEVARTSNDKAVKELAVIFSNRLNENIQTAMRESKVIAGMSGAQVRQIWGRPNAVISGDALHDIFRRAGIFEIWRYDNKPDVTFDINRNVRRTPE